MNKARIEHEDRHARQGGGNQSDFDMSLVEGHEINLLAHSISSKYRNEARIHLHSFSSI
jgi:hypothetical protein